VCRELGISIVPYSPLGRGALTGALASRADLPANDHRRSMPWFSEGAMEENLTTTLDVLQRIAGELEATPGQVALAWLLAKGDDVVPIPGTRRVRYMEENAASASLTLTDAYVRALDAITANGARAAAGTLAATNWTDGVTPALEA
jgi:aryl-alcohol dehydrogenase-like predicted oxidoreductase